MTREHGAVFTHENIFLVLADVAGGRITGEKKDTLTVFYKGGGSNYFHIGHDADHVLEQLVGALESRVPAYADGNA